MKTITQGTVIRATFRPIDLIPAFLEEAWGRGYTKEVAELLRDSNDGNLMDGSTLLDAIHGSEPFTADEENPYWDPETMGLNGWTAADDHNWVLEQLFDLLNKDLPDGLYFGAHPGDGSDFGYWGVEE
jgi:hypothetical protein